MRQKSKHAAKVITHTMMQLHVKSNMEEIVHEKIIANMITVLHVTHYSAAWLKARPHDNDIDNKRKNDNNKIQSCAALRAA